MLAEVSPQRVHAVVAKLVSFGTRHTLSDTASETRGIGAARRWIQSEMERAAASSERSSEEAPRVYFDSHVQAADGKRISREVEIVNVVGELPGSSAEGRKRRIYVMGHYDSRASDAMDSTSDAPGANDDASGAAVAIELFRVMAKRRFPATLVFMANAGEEQGLFGAKAHAEAAKAQGLEIVAVLNNDIVGDPSAPAGPRRETAVRVFSEGLPANASPEDVKAIRGLAGESDAPSRQLARYIDEVAKRQKLHVLPMLVFRPDRFLRGGDHMAFLEAGYPAVRFTTVEEHYDRQHQDVKQVNGKPYGDVAEFVDAEYLANVARLNGAALAHLASAPPAPRNVRIVTANLQNDTTLRWELDPSGETARYEVVWRYTTNPLWEHAQDAGKLGEVTLPINKDNVLFGVRSCSKDGLRSLVTFAHAAKE